MPLSLAHYSRGLPILAGVVLIFLFLHLRSTGFGTNTSPVIVEPEVNDSKLGNQTIPASKIDPHPEIEIQVPAQPCPLPGMEDILVILKTGVTESHERVPIHFNTTLRCIPHLLIASDFEETINGFKTHDVFRNMSESVRENKDFALYNRARENGTEGLTAQDMIKVENSAAGMSDNPGWKLDKWKFLPMAVEARNYYPDAKWYVVLEADTYPIWTNLLALLANHDPAKKLYIGNQMQIGADIFAHGGSGFILSNSAINAVADTYTANEEEWHVRTDAHWAGDCILGQLLSEIGIPLTWSSPHVSGNSLWEQNAFAAWCHPPVTFHHMTPDDIEFVYEFDSDWHANVSSYLNPISIHTANPIVPGNRQSAPLQRCILLPHKPQHRRRPTKLG